MFITLPCLLGGQALKDAVFNHPVLLDKDGRESLKQDRCFVDLCFVKQKIAVEYQGFAAHHGENNINKDSPRMMALSRMGYTVIFVTKSQLYHLSKFKQLSAQLAKLLGARVRVRTEKFARALTQLRMLLPGVNQDSGINADAADKAIELRAVLLDIPFYEWEDFISFLQSLRVPGFYRKS